MRFIITILLLLFLPALSVDAQVIFKTYVKSTVETGTPFSVEYILENIEEDDGFIQPFFRNLQLVRGPDVRQGSVTTASGLQPVKNYIFILVANKPGYYIIPGATAKVNGHFIRSANVRIEVIGKNEEEGNSSEYFLQPGEDPYEKIRRNLFMKVLVNKHSCYIGQPVVATFKLYSRLQSKSDIVKNPGFYGFSVQDMINLDDKISNTEIIGGKVFIVHTIRTVQLYPLQAGVFTIDAMEVMNKVEFSTSIVNKKTEQEISEGFFENKEETRNDNNTVTYESSTSTEKIAVHVKSYPEKNKPPSFSGATGKFTINAFLEKSDLSLNEEGDLVVIISGKGNFTQLTAPAIQWPEGVEGFEAVIKDTLDKTHAPLKGALTFRFPFVAPKAGSYTVPPVSFAFFDTDSNKYRTVSTKPVEIKINEKEKEVIVATGQEDSKKFRSGISRWVFGGGLLILLLGTAWWFIYKRKERKLPGATTTEKGSSPADPVQPAYTALKENDSRFYIILQKVIWDYLSSTLQLSGSRINKQEIVRSNHILPGQSQEIIAILEQCEAAAFTKAEFLHDKEELLLRTKNVLEQIVTHQ